MKQHRISRSWRIASSFLHNVRLTTLGMACVFSVLLVPPAWADGGKGGAGLGGAGGSTSATSVGGDGGYGNGNGGGGGGAGVTGGAGGSGGSRLGGDPGGAGGASPGAAGDPGSTSPPISSAGGGGGGGAHGGVGAGLPASPVGGGKGGDGAGSFSNLTGGGGGGAGGWGWVVTGGGNLGVLGASVTGGNGGNGGNANSFAGSGGDGGVGLYFNTAGVTGTINAAVIGGNGGAAGLGFASSGLAGAGGAGIVGSNLALTIAGTGSVTGGSGANAITFGGGANTLALQSGAALSGNIAVNGGGTLGITPAIDYTLGSGITGDGSVTKNGTQALTLTGASSYTGATTVAAGKLLVDGSISASSLVTVNSGATLGGAGSVTGVTVSSGGIVYPGDLAGDFATLNTRALSIHGIAEFDVGAAAADRIVSSGTVDLGGATLTLHLIAAPPMGTQFTLISTTGALSGTFTGLPDGKRFTLNGTDFVIHYTATAAMITAGTLQLTLNPTSASADIGTAFSAVTATVSDRAGSLYAGQSLTVSAPASGASASCTVSGSTDANGRATLACTPNGTAGSYSVNVCLVSDSSVCTRLALTNTVGHPACSSPNILQTFTNSSAAGTATGSIQSIVVPSSSVTIDALGAQGGAGSSGGGRGAEVAATVAVTPGQTLCVVVGGQGGSSDNGAGGGGGGSFVYAIAGGTCASNLASVTAANLLVAAGGGGGSGLATAGRDATAPAGAGVAGASTGTAGDQGGASGGSGGNGGGAVTNSGGGGGLLTNGAAANTVPGGQALIHGASGGIYSGFANGGFGGGGAAASPGGGGGGYNGGGAGGISTFITGGGGGGSFSATAPLSPYTQSGVRSGNGLVTLCYAPAIATHFSISAPASAVAGTAFGFTLTALDASNNVVTGYVGTVHFTSTDPQASLPADYTFVAGDAGVHTFTNGATLRTAGSRTITATDTSNSSIVATSGAINVSAASATHFAVSAPATVTAANAFAFTVTALDAFNNPATGYGGIAHFASSDSRATLPADAALSGGAGTFNATLKTAGTQTLTATDILASSITGISNSISVGAPTITVKPTSFPGGTVGTAYNQVASASGGAAPYTFGVAAGTLPTGLTFNSSTGALSGTPSAAGSFNFTVQATDANGFTGASTYTIAVAQGTQTITFTSTPPTNPAVTGTYAVAATGGASGNPVTFSIDAASTPNACTAAGNVVSFTGTGTCIVDADQAGNSNYAAATRVQQTMSVGKKTTTMSLVATPSPATVGKPVTLTATVAGDPPTGTVSFADNGAALPCSPVTLVPGTTNSTATCTATFNATGSHSITATYSGDSNFATVTSPALAVAVNAEPQPAVAAPMLDRWALLLLSGLLGASVFLRFCRAERHI